MTEARAKQLILGERLRYRAEKPHKLYGIGTIVEKYSRGVGIVWEEFPNKVEVYLFWGAITNMEVVGG